MTSHRMNIGRLLWAGGRQLFLLLALGCGLVRSQAQSSPAVGLHFGSDYTNSQYESFGDWLGLDVKYRVVFMEKKSWTSIAEPAFLHITKAWVNSQPGRVEVISMALLPDSETGGFAIVTSGARDKYFKAFAAKLQSEGIADKVIVRLAWEANGDWYKWSLLQNPSGFKSAYRRAVQVMRAAAPKLRFEFCISNLANRGTTGAKWSDGYPGNDVVDVISMDIYDHWNTWDRMLRGDAGLMEMRAFAIANNKPEAYAEWSCSTTKNGHGDNPTFISNMAAWMRARPGQVLYQAYWNTTGGSNAMLYGSSTILVPQSAARYRQEFNSTALPTPPTISAIANRTVAANGSTGPISFTIGDAQTPAVNLTLTTNTSDANLIPLANITLGGSGANRTVTIQPAGSKTGWATIWVKVSDGTLSSVTSFLVTVTAPVVTVSPPTITAIANQTIAANGSTGAIAFTIGDAQTPAANLTLTTNASDLNLIPLANVTLGGSGANRTVTIKPAANKSGWSTIWVKVGDGALSTVRSFVVSVLPPVNTVTPPTITAIANQAVAVNGNTGAIAFTIGDAETPAANLTLTTNASNPALIPLGNITLGGSGANRTVTLRPVSNKTGWSTIWVKVSDGALATVTSFVVNVTAGLTFTDIGNPAIAGTQTVNGSTITMRAGGYDIYNREDEFSFAHQTIAGDAELTVRVASLTKAHDWTKAGLMFRGSLADHAAFVAVFLTPAKGLSLQWRAQDGGECATSASLPGTAPKWLRLLRTANSFFAFYSADGVTWDLVETIDVDLPAGVPAGLAVTSHATTTATTAVFDGLVID